MRDLLTRFLCAALAAALPAAAVIAQPAAPQPAAQPVQLDVDLNQRIAPFTPIYAWFGYDEANYTTMPHGRQLLRELHDLAPVPVYIRAHHLLTSGDGKPELKFSSTNIYSEDAQGHPVYNFNLLDGIFDAWKAAGVRPLVELGFMPRDLAATLPNRHEPYQVHFPASTISGASNNPPKDYARWQELCRVLTAHLVERYGPDEVLHWYFEVWNEPDIDYWHSTPEDYFRLYDFAVAGVRAALPGARVGGPATTSPRSDKARAFLRSFLEHVQAGHSAATGGAIPLDFISFHAKGSPTIQGTTVTMGLNRELSDVDRGFALIASFPQFRHLPIILSEADPEGCAACSSRDNPANNYRNGTLYPAYTAAALKAILDLRDRHSVDLISMLSWSFEFEERDYFEGFRSLATNGIDKPILNLFRMLGLMSGDRVRTTSTGAVSLETLMATGVRQSPDVDALATRDSHAAAVLLWNYHDINTPMPGAPVSVTVHGIPAGVHRVLLQHYRIDETHSNAYTAWLAMGSPQHPDATQYARLQAAGQLELLTSPQWLDIRDGTITLTTSLPHQSLSLLRLTWQ
ncbi:MAG: beta-xylosidase [Acidobacteriota bacterium]|nr:beta-xylosidase [Acidobacteriota bacterium]